MSDSDAQPLAERGSNRSQRPTSQAFKDFIASGWAPRPDAAPPRAEVAAHTPARRTAITYQFPGDRLVIPAGGLRTRSNDTDYRFRAHSAFSHLTGMGSRAEPDAVLVLHPGGRAVLYIRPRAERDTEEFYADSRYGELWVGARPTLADVEDEYAIECAHIDELPEALGKDTGPGGVRLRVVSGADPAVTALVESIRVDSGQAEADAAALAAAHEQARAEAVEQGRDPQPVPVPITADAELLQALSELRLVKDEWEIAQLRAAVAASVQGFTEIVAALPQALDHHRGERVIETAFDLVARRDGNGTGYDTIAAAGAHACTLHWIGNDGPVRPGDLVLIDAGVEVDSLYTADVTRTLPVNGRFSDAQRQVYDAVREAADAAFAIARPGRKFHELHDAAMQVIATRLEEWGLLPVAAQKSLDPATGGQHRRWMVHGTSHHLGIDVHDCAQARRDMYLDAELQPGMVFTIEPGLYFQPDDLLVPEELRGIGVRIEDDVLVTADGCENLSAALPRAAADVEAWMARVWAGGV